MLNYRSFAQVILVGVLGHNAQVRQTKSGSAMLTFSVATKSSVKQATGGYQTVTTWHDCLMWECQDFCVWGGYSRGSPTRLPFVFEMQYARPDAIAGAKVEGPARSAGGSSLAPAIARREAAGALAREV